MDNFLAALFFLQCSYFKVRNPEKVSFDEHLLKKSQLEGCKGKTKALFG